MARPAISKPTAFQIVLTALQSLPNGLITRLFSLIYHLHRAVSL
jgi:hypothetical protein